MSRLPLLAILIIITSISIITIQDSFAEGERKKVIFTGNQIFSIERERPSLSYFYSEPYIDLPYKVTANVNVGGKKIEMSGDGFTQPIGYRYDKTCKRISGHENLNSEQGDFITLTYNGVACIISPQKKVISVAFIGSNQKGIFDGYVVSGTITGTSDFYERVYNLKINSIMVTPKG